MLDVEKHLEGGVIRAAAEAIYAGRHLPVHGQLDGLSRREGRVAIECQQIYVGCDLLIVPYHNLLKGCA